MPRRELLQSIFKGRVGEGFIGCCKLGQKSSLLGAVHGSLVVTLLQTSNETHVVLQRGAKAEGLGEGPASGGPEGPAQLQLRGWVGDPDQALLQEGEGKGAGGPEPTLASAACLDPLCWELGRLWPGRF